MPNVVGNRFFSKTSYIWTLPTKKHVSVGKSLTWKSCGNSPHEVVYHRIRNLHRTATVQSTFQVRDEAKGLREKNNFARAFQTLNVPLLSNENHQIPEHFKHSIFQGLSNQRSRGTFWNEEVAGKNKQFTLFRVIKKYVRQLSPQEMT